MWEGIKGERVNPTTAAIHLEDFFKENAKKKQTKEMYIVLIDELDALMTKKQQLLYNIFDWPGWPKSNLIIITIANTMDLPERFRGNVKSRLGTNWIVYEPYTDRQIIEILWSKVHRFNIFKADAIVCVAKKVSSLSGDIRRAL